MQLDIIDTSILAAIINKMDHVAQHNVDEFHNIPVCKHLVREEIEDIVDTWKRLNTEAYNLDMEPAFQKVYTPITSTFDQTPISPYQFLKGCRYVKANIPLSLIQQNSIIRREEYRALNILNHLITQTMERIIDSLPTYQNTQLDF